MSDDGYLIKLVRDRIDLALGDHPAARAIVYRPIEDPDQLREEMRKKLIEEAAEYAIKPSASEMADVLEIAHALIAYDLSATRGYVEELMVRKRAQRGAFNDGIGMYAERSVL